MQCAVFPFNIACIRSTGSDKANSPDRIQIVENFWMSSSLIILVLQRLMEQNHVMFRRLTGDFRCCEIEFRWWVYIFVINFKIVVKDNPVPFFSLVERFRLAGWRFWQWPGGKGSWVRSPPKHLCYEQLSWFSVWI